MRRYCTIASKMICRWASTSCSLCQVTCLRNCETGKMALAVSQRLMWLRRMWRMNESWGMLKMLSCSSFSVLMRITSSFVTGSRKMKSPKPMCSSSKCRRSTFIFFEFLSTKWNPSASAFWRLMVSELSMMSGTYSSCFLISFSSFSPASGSPSSTWLSRPTGVCIGKRVSLMMPSVFSWYFCQRAQASPWGGLSCAEPQREG